MTTKLKYCVIPNTPYVGYYCDYGVLDDLDADSIKIFDSKDAAEQYIDTELRKQLIEGFEFGHEMDEEIPKQLMLKCDPSENDPDDATIADGFLQFSKCTDAEREDILIVLKASKLMPFKLVEAETLS